MLAASVQAILGIDNYSGDRPDGHSFGEHTRDYTPRDMLTAYDFAPAVR